MEIRLPFCRPLKIHIHLNNQKHSLQTIFQASRFKPTTQNAFPHPDCQLLHGSQRILALRCHVNWLPPGASLQLQMRGRRSTTTPQLKGPTIFSRHGTCSSLLQPCTRASKPTSMSTSSFSHGCATSLSLSRRAPPLRFFSRLPLSTVLYDDDRIGTDCGGKLYEDLLGPGLDLDLQGCLFTHD